MSLRPQKRIAVLAASVSSIAGSSLILAQGMGGRRRFLLAGVAILCGSLLAYIAVIFNREKKSRT